MDSLESTGVKLFDSHCHLDAKEFKEDFDGVLARAFEAGVARLLMAADSEASSREVLRLAGEKNGKNGQSEAVPEIWASIGIHPHEAEGALEGGDIPKRLLSLLDMPESDLIVAIGETGLDFFYDNSPRTAQAEAFERQILWAKSARKPVIVHIRNAANRSEGDACREAMAIMKNCGADACGGVIHCFSGEKRDARAALDMGFYISFAGPVTYPKADELRQAVAYVPLDRLLCETDSPYLAPQSERGKRNEPAFVREAYEKIAGVRNMSLEGFAAAVWENGENLFAGSHGNK
jgi:TatD DNase family protein